MTQQIERGTAVAFSPDPYTTLYKYSVSVSVVGRTGAVVSIADYEPRGPWFKTWPRHYLSLVTESIIF